MKIAHDLTINFVCMQPNLSGAYKATKLLAEALVRRGHRVHLHYLRDMQRPPLTQPRPLLRRLRAAWQARGSGYHFDSSIATSIACIRPGGLLGTQYPVMIRSSDCCPVVSPTCRRIV